MEGIESQLKQAEDEFQSILVRLTEVQATIQVNFKKIFFIVNKLGNLTFSWFHLNQNN